MVNVIGVRFQNAGKLYFFDPGAYWPTPGDFVVVETARGIEFGEVVTSVREINDEMLQSPLKKVVRIATAEDVRHAQENKAGEKEAYAICQKKIAEHKLDMKLVSVEYTFDNSKILFYFTANGRVDFRSLVKDLAAVFKTRIELRQIGVRDEAKMLGGLGPCGRPICCGAFLGDFQPVSIKMAKEQNLSLNPTKISGVCGRLMCCLKYEQDNYEQTRKRMPKVGKEVITPDGPGVVWDLNIIKETVRVRIQKGDSSELKDYPMAEVQRPGQQPAPVKEEAENKSAEEAPAAVEADASAETVENQPRAKRERSEQKRPQKERRDKPAQHHDNEKMGKPVQRENPARKNKEENASKADTPQQKPASAPAPAKEASKQESASPWKAAVERALRAAQGGEQNS
ncbi:MAG: stage 0 sporulation protein [Clostridia bacterium]|nr:stage 0 sporulation protein [Clostridia bacterium]